jgi:hypothetical protein
MELQTFQYHVRGGWSVENFPPMDSEHTLLLVFAAPEFMDDPAPFRQLAQHYPHSKIIGCSSAGEIFGPNIYDQSLSVAVMRFEKTTLKAIKTKINSAADSHQVGRDIIEQLDRTNLRSVFVLSDGMHVNGSELVKGLNILGKQDLVITGGLAGDGKNFKRTWAVYGGEVLSDHVVAVGLYGDDIDVGHASRGGWDIFGPERLITRAKENILYELDGQPALALYKEYLGERAEGLPATGLLYPLAIRENFNDVRQLVRTILGIDEKTQSLIFAGDMPTGHLAQLMRANFDRLIDSATEAAELVANQISVSGTNSSHPMLSIAISCVGRRLLLGERTEEETESLLMSLPQGTQQIGFYSYGEISPFTTGSCDLHNQTMTITTITES